MFGWLQIFFVRLASGEKMRKADERDYRSAGAVFVSAPIFFALCHRCGKSLLPNPDSATQIWLIFVVGALLGFAILRLWSRLVPPLVSFLLAIPAWGWCIWEYLYGIPR